MGYFPSEEWSDKLFSNGDYFRDSYQGNAFLDNTLNYRKILTLALASLSVGPTAISFDDEYDSELLDLSKEHGVFLMIKTVQNTGGCDHIIAIPMSTSTEPTDVYVLLIKDQTYDGLPLADNEDLEGSNWEIYPLGKPFVFKVETLLREFYQEKPQGYDSINKRSI